MEVEEEEAAAAAEAEAEEGFHWNRDEEVEARLDQDLSGGAMAVWNMKTA